MDHQQHDAAPCSTKAVLEARRRLCGPNVALSYTDPVVMVRGEGTYLFDQHGQRYLDCVNNVAHVGHCHPKVTAAVCAQMQTLNTNSRYLSPGLTNYMESLVATLPHPLKVGYLVCSGSEANDLALRIARTAAPGAQHVVVMGGAYHGHLSSLIPLSPYKFWGTGGEGKERWVHVLSCPDPLRGRNMDGRKAAKAALEAARRAGGRVAAFICEGILSCGGQIILPPGYLAAVYEEMRAAGALCIADEVQCGFGRVGEAMWAFETQGVVPDIVTMGKPIGNGFPMAAVVTNARAAAGFANGMEFFATTGGCNAATAAGAAVLQVLVEERLQEKALDTGAYLRQQLQGVMAECPFIADVRGMGLFIGIEFVTDTNSLTHAPMLACWVKERAKARHVLLTTDGPYDNVIKIKPPMVFGRGEADHLVATLRAVLFEDLTPEVLAGLRTQEEAHRLAVVAPRMALYRANEVDLNSIYDNSSARSTNIATAISSSTVSSETMVSSSSNRGSAPRAGMGSEGASIMAVAAASRL